MSEIDKLIDELEVELDGNLSEAMSELVDRFIDFHQANPHVYREFRKIVMDYKAAGFRHWSHKSAIEVMRWRFDIQTRDASSSFKLGNDYSALYARMLMANEPSLEGFLEIRQLWR